MRRLAMILRVLPHLGLANVARVTLYRSGIRTGLHPALKVGGSPVSGPFFRTVGARRNQGLNSPRRWLASHLYFSCHEFAGREPPDWNASPFEDGAAIPADRPWHEISDFGAGVADIKCLWESSRYEWALAMAQRAALGDRDELQRLNEWLEDWQANCPPYMGPNWKCGQEASIRVMHLAAAALVLDEHAAPLPGLLALIEQHLRRIFPTLSYARAQDNNHGTSEAAALFIGGSWLEAAGRPQGRRWASAGRAALEERCLHLIEQDGTFSQYSVTYHRLMLDTMSLCEIWRQRQGLEPFSPELMARLRAATHWLRQLVDPGTGDAPNLGANDGALLMPLADCDFRDFRPTLQLAAALFCNARAITPDGAWNEPLKWLQVSLPSGVLPPIMSESFDRGGLHVLRNDRAAAYLRYPRYRFRPSQADALHLDLWVDGANLLRDGGTYSYAEGPGRPFLGSTAAHNTAQFDGRDQMPRAGRFLFADWLQARSVRSVATAGNEIEAAAGYRDAMGAEHHRTIILSPTGLRCIDRLSGNAANAVIRWRLMPGPWTLDNRTLSGCGIRLSVSSSRTDLDLSMTESVESRYYHAMSSLPVLEITTAVPAVIETVIEFS